MLQKKIAIQGTLGSNHHKVAIDLYGEGVALQECMSFDELVKALIDDSASEGIMAIENTIAGSIIPNYALIDRNDLHITAEVYLPIHHHLMALKGQQIQDITEVCSHPMALLQCKDFFTAYPHIKLVEDVDTAEVAKRISQQQLKGVAAIAPKMAADLFGLAVLQDEIQTIKQNATRFVVLSKTPNDSSEINKASLKFQLDHKRGSLAAILNAMSDCNMNLTKIQSLPVIEKPWKYAFFVDVTFETVKDFEKTMALIQIMAEECKLLGTYKSGIK